MDGGGEEELPLRRGSATEAEGGRRSGESGRRRPQGRLVASLGRKEERRKEERLSCSERKRRNTKKKRETKAKSNRIEI